MILPLLIVAALGCRTTLEPTTSIPEDDPEQEWDRLLRKVVDRDGYVRYDRLAKRRQVLERYVAWVGRDGALRGKRGPAAHAFWLNTFNALVLYQVVERELAGSVLDVPGLPWRGSGFFFWTDFVVGGGAPASLWEIGHERVIEAQQDYRDFAALTLAARSSPPLRAGVYQAEQLGDQLDQAFTAWIQDDRGVRFEGGRALFNPIFEQYAFEVGLFTHHADLCRVAAHHAEGRRKKRLEELARDGCPHGYFPFDWRLNDAAAVAEAP